MLPVLTRSQRDRIRRTADAIIDRVMSVAQDMNRDAELWLFSLVTPLERGLRDKQAALRKRIEMIERMGDAQHNLQENLAGVAHMVLAIEAKHEELRQRTRAIQVALNPAAVQPSPVPAPQPASF